MDVDPAYAELLGKLNSLTGQARKKVLTKSLKAGGTLIQAAIVEKAPIQVGKPRGVLKPGDLKKDIKVRVHVGSDEAAATDTDRVTIGPTRKTMDIALDVETGHANRPRNVESKRKRSERTPAHPFVRPAYDATKDAAMLLMGETMAAEIKKVMDA